MRKSVSLTPLCLAHKQICIAASARDSRIYEVHSDVIDTMYPTFRTSSRIRSHIRKLCIRGRGFLARPKIPPSTQDFMYTLHQSTGTYLIVFRSSNCSRIWAQRSKISCQSPFKDSQSENSFFCSSNSLVSYRFFH
jgi:hypothetical protein